MKAHFDLRRLVVRLAIVALAALTVALAVVVGADALTALRDAGRAYQAAEGLTVAGLAFTFVVLTTPRVLRTLT